MRLLPGSHRQRRRGTALVQIVLCLTFLAGVLAVVLDGGVLLAERRHAQAVADAAALAGAADLFARWATNNGVDPSGSSPAVASATSTANQNGYTGSNSSITVNVNPSKYQGGPNVGQTIPAGYVEVIVTYNQARFFSALWGTSTIPVSARAVARGQWTPAAPGLLTLDPSANGAIEATGNGSITVRNAAIVDDSKSSSAILTSGSNAVITDASPGQPIDVTGGFSGGGITPSPTTGVTPMADPLRFLPVPTQPANAPAATTSNGVTTYYPGYYPSGLSLTGGYTAVFSPGTYFMNGAFKVNGNSSSALTGSGVMIYVDGSGSVSIAGNGSVTLSPPTSGTYQGLSIFQDRANTSTLSITGNGAFNLSGTVYAADAIAKVTGNGDVVGSQYIVGQFQNKGAGNNGQVVINYNNGNVAKTRQLNLVE
jgi:Flp pilus assembly protein TadG